MFLNALQERNRELFLEVCLYASMANEVLAAEEKEMIYAYCREMNIEEHIPDIGGSFEELTAKLAMQANDTEKRIIVLEILGLVKSDGSVDEKEKSFFDKFVEGLQVEKEIVSRLDSLLESYTVICKEMYAAVCG